MRKLESKVYRTSSKLLILSKFMQDRLTHFFAIPTHQSCIVAGAAEQQIRFDAAQRHQLRTELGWHKPVISTLRNLVPRTGVDLMIQAASIVKHAGYDVQFLVMGDGVLRESLEGLAAALHVSDKVEFTGFLAEKDVQNRLLASDIFMVPTRGLEGFGLVTLEANAWGVPVLATPISANKELVPSIQHNQLAAHVSPLALAEALMKMLDNPINDAQRLELQTQANQQYHWQKHDVGFIQCVKDLT
jgi:glycosyltransferase involved in cell wall biosynthesis